MGSRSPDILYVTNKQGPRRALMDVFNGAGLLISIADSREDAISMATDQALDAIIFHAEDATALLRAEQLGANQQRQADTLYEIMLLADRPDLSLPNILTEAAELLPQITPQPQDIRGYYAHYEAITSDAQPPPGDGWHIASPLREGQRQVGEIGLTHPLDSYTFPPQTERFLTMVASVLSSRITREALSQTLETIESTDVAMLRRENERLRVLHQIDTAILSQQTTMEIAELTIRELQKLVDFRRASLTLFDFAANEAISIFTHDPDTRGMRIPLVRVHKLIDLLRDGQPHIEPDLYSLETPSPAEQVWIQRGIRSYTMFPLVFEGELFGSLNLGRLQPGSLSQATLGLVAEVSGRMATALYAAHQRETDQQQVRELEEKQATLTRQINASTSELYATNERLEREIRVRQQAESAEHQQRILAESLRDIATALNSSLDFNDVLDQVLASIGRVLPFDAINIMLVEQGDRVRISRARGYEDQSPDEVDLKAVFPLAQRDYLRIMHNTHLPLIINDTHDSEFWGNRPEQAWIRSYIGAPIITDGIVIGFINVKSVAPGYYQDNHLERLKMFTDQAAIAFRNARDHEKAIQYAMVEDRQRLARDLHDAVSQTLFSATVVAGTALRGWARSPESVQPQLEQLNRLIRGALAEMRTLLLELRPQALEDTALNELVRQLAEAYSGRNRSTIGIEITGDADLPASVKIEFYRILQEALNNVSKHARASHVRVTLTYTARSVDIEVIDDGRGFVPDAVDPGAMGLNIMRERARHIGAELSIESQPNHGTRLTLHWNRPN